MTREEILNLAREAGLSAPQEVMVNDFWMAEDADLMRFAALVAAAENEACAEVAEQTVCDTHLPTGVKIYGGRAAKAIRARREFGPVVVQGLGENLPTLVAAAALKGLKR